MTKKPLLLKVVFDTNPIHKESASYLLCRSVRELIERHSGHQDLVIKWILPSVVLRERQYQMTEVAKKMLLEIKDFEGLLPVPLRVDEKNLLELVKTATRKQIRELKVEVEQLKTESINWDELIDAALFRKPPFSSGRKEKGFRDSLVLETFLQILKTSPSTPSNCIVALVTWDKELGPAATNKCRSKQNARVVNTEDLEQLINTLVGDVSEEFVQEIRELAEQYFCDSQAKEGLYYAKGVENRIRSKFSDDLAGVPAGADVTRMDPWTIGKPQFLEKQGQRVSWNTRITAHRKALRRYEEYYQPRVYTQSLFDGVMVAEGGGEIFSYKQSLEGSNFSGAIPAISPDALPLTTYKEKVLLEGETTFDVRWSVSVSAKRHSFSEGSIDKLLFVTTTWLPPYDLEFLNVHTPD